MYNLSSCLVSWTRWLIRDVQTRTLYVRGSSSSGGEGWIPFDEPLCLRNIIFRWKKSFRKGELPAKAARCIRYSGCLSFLERNVSIFRP